MEPDEGTERELEEENDRLPNAPRLSELRTERATEVR